LRLIDMDFGQDQPEEYGLLAGCMREGQRAGFVAKRLDLLRNEVNESLHRHMLDTMEQIRNTSRLLIELFEKAYAHQHRIPVIVNYLYVLLPCVSRTLRDITTHYDNKALSKEIRWRTMYHEMTKEAGGIPMPARFAIYSNFITMLIQLLVRSKDFDMNALEAVQTSVLELRQKRGIPPPPLQAVSGPLVGPGMLVPMFGKERPDTIHWAEDIFSRPLPCRTPLKHLRESRAYGPWRDPRLPPNSKTLFKRSFDNNRLSITMAISSADDSPWVVVRQTFPNQVVYTMTKGVHELCIERDGSALILKRWSQASQCAKMWAELYFITWEGKSDFFGGWWWFLHDAAGHVTHQPEAVEIS